MIMLYISIIIIEGHDKIIYKWLFNRKPNF